MREFLYGDDLGEACVFALEPWLLPRPLSCQPIWMSLSVRLWINRLGCTPVWQLMRLLLDTQVMLWWLLEDPRLSAKTRDLMAASPCVVSVASIWEVAIKHRLAKLPVAPAAFRNQLPLVHHDPFDRVIGRPLAWLRRATATPSTFQYCFRY